MCVYWSVCLLYIHPFSLLTAIYIFLVCANTWRDDTVCWLAMIHPGPCVRRANHCCVNTCTRGQWILTMPWVPVAMRCAFQCQEIFPFDFMNLWSLMIKWLYKRVHFLFFIRTMFFRLNLGKERDNYRQLPTMFLNFQQISGWCSIEHGTIL